VRTASRDGGVCCGMKKCCAHCITFWWCVLWNEKLLCALHHVMVVFVVESKSVVRTASRDVGVCVMESKTTVRTASRDGGVCCGMKNYCVHCIT
jgi:hypothetical protein